ncbi:MAG TPA: site-specific DNA-methyltransferase [Acetobacteraceae bacterium]|jgi:DNA modification methylase
MSIKLLHGDCRSILPTLPDNSVHAVVTSPPYFGLRDYGTGTWEGGDPACGHRVGRQNGQLEVAYRAGNGGEVFRSGTRYIEQGEVARDICSKCGARRIDRQIGLEATPDDYLATMVQVFREVRRVLRNDGVMFCNMGDAYSNKQLQMMPARLAIELQRDGWYLRSMLPWLKRSAMPESVTDRPASAVEYVFLLTKQSRYFWDAEAVKRGLNGNTHSRGTKRSPPIEAAGIGHKDWCASMTQDDAQSARNMRNSDLFYDSLEDAPEARIDRPRRGEREARGEAAGVAAQPKGHLGDWLIREPSEPLGLICSDDGSPLALDVNPAAFSAAHFATFPPKLVEPLIRAGTSERGCCAQCGAPWRRMTTKTFVPQPDVSLAKGIKGAFNQKPMDASNGWDGVPRGTNDVRTTGWSPGCAHDAAVVPCTVLDPFSGAGTTLLVADRLQRDAIGIELSDAYGAMADARVVDDAPLLAWGAAQLAEAAE